MASMALPVPLLCSGGLDGHDGNESNSHSEEEDNEEEPKKAVFVRCPLCRNSKEMCESCKKRQNREASRRNREKHTRTKAELDRMRSRFNTLKAQHREDRNFIQALMMAGVRFCQRCGNDLINLPMANATLYNVSFANAQRASNEHGLRDPMGPQTPDPHHDNPSLSSPTLANVPSDGNFNDTDFFDMEAWLNADDDTYD